MHKLNRSLISSPHCLQHYHHGQHRWQDVCFEDKEEIRNALRKMQGWRCAYCECEIGEGDSIVEHFRQRGRHPTETFKWSNLFLSCCCEDSCGIHKDRCKSYHVDDLIKPDIDDPECYFYFVSDGTINIRAELNDKQRQRAMETLRVFNLHPMRGRLRNMRETAVARYYGEMEFVRQLVESGELGDAQEYMEILLDEITSEPFYTAIKHFITS